MENYIGEIKLFAGNYAPVNWAFCDGSLQSIAENTALFSLLGTTYGGDGVTTFALPDLRGRVPVNQGRSNSGTTYILGEEAGVENVTLLNSQIPAHNHTFNVSTNVGTSPLVSNHYYSAPVAPTDPPSSNKSIVFYQPDTAGEVKSVLRPNTLTLTGSNMPHTNMQPYLVITYIIALYGIYPSFND
ncbi:phage tail protein [Emticicia sp. CRIBPO]|uniref:phage tail protein n=1 Tax=Emticicia sp. CRIBPO TaxID=2683258 RepID=UPI001411D1D5|nr:tail fiber protein [Emticicia sp. CRIBPO]NBA88064.1 phage tail protein [Emticicia sp. CRIBPO]